MRADLHKDRKPMKAKTLLRIFAPLSLAFMAGVARADDSSACIAPPGAACAAPPSAGCVAPPVASCDCDPNACDCCGPGTNKWDGTLKVGIGLRTSYNYMNAQNAPGVPAVPGTNLTPATAGTPGGSSVYNFFNPDDMRIYLNGSAFGGLIKGTLNTEVAGGGTFVSPDNVTQIELLDGIAKFEYNDKVNFWTGRFLPPTDRANLDGPFYQTPYDYPFVSNYPSLLAGRDDGAAYWGQAGGGKLKWQLGIFNGIGRNYDAYGNATGPNATGELFYIARVTVNLFDPEPGYYTQSCYFGDKEILAIGMTVAGQTDGAGSAAAPTAFTAESIDVLWEHKLGNCGVIDFEGAFYNYNYGNILSSANPALNDPNQGDSGYAQLSYLMPQNICFGRLSGKLQPFARYENYHRVYNTATATSTAASPILTEGTNIGVNYVISGYNARLTVAWGQREAEGGESFSLLRSGVQLQY